MKSPDAAKQSSPGGTIRRVALDWLGHKPTPDHLAILEKAVLDAVDALEAFIEETEEWAYEQGFDGLAARAAKVLGRSSDVAA